MHWTLGKWLGTSKAWAGNVNVGPVLVTNLPLVPSRLQPFRRHCLQWGREQGQRPRKRRRPRLRPSPLFPPQNLTQTRRRGGNSLLLVGTTMKPLTRGGPLLCTGKPTTFSPPSRIWDPVAAGTISTCYGVIIGLV